MLQQYAPHLTLPPPASGGDSSALSTEDAQQIQRLCHENQELQRYLAAQQQVLASLERRTGRSLSSLGVHVHQLSTLSGQANAASQWQASLSAVQNEVDSLCDLLADAMLLQKLEAGRVAVHCESVQLERLLDTITRHLLAPASHSADRLCCQFSPNLPSILADWELLEAVLMDLLARGLKYADVESTATFSAVEAGENVQFTISAQRFAPVGDRDFATEILLCCRRIEVQGGTIVCHQQPNGWQTVVITLPTVDCCND
jgi:signal transduction histidine kinase